MGSRVFTKQEPMRIGYVSCIEINGRSLSSIVWAPFITQWPSDVTLRDQLIPDNSPYHLVNLHWIDIHNHAQTLSFRDRQQFALAGCELMVMTAYGYHWSPYKPVRPTHVRHQWDDSLSRLYPIMQSHPFVVKLGIGIHTGTRVTDHQELIEVLPEYCELDVVGAIGEPGITPQQQGAKWALLGQESVVRSQMGIG